MKEESAFFHLPVPLARPSSELFFIVFLPGTSPLYTLRTAHRGFKNTIPDSCISTVYVYKL